jgi:nitroreductase/FMN reductase [NAD(P)H]
MEHPVTDLTEIYGRRFGLEAPGDLAKAELPDAALGILARRSIRRYRAEAVPNGLLDVLLACAQSAPTKSNLQQYSILVLRDDAKRERLAKLLPGMPWAAGAPVFLFFLGDVRRGRRVARMRGYEHRNDNVDTFMNAAVDAALAMQCFIDAAEAAGLGCCPISMVRNELDAMTDLLQLPAGVFPVAGLAAGWPDEEGRVSMRLPPSVVVHRDRYDDSELEAEIAAYDDRAFAVAPIPPEKQRHVDRYGIAERGIWSENVARQLSLPERAAFRDWLRQQKLSLD